VTALSDGDNMRESRRTTKREDNKKKKNLWNLFIFFK
jgi:hypothetical protein